MPTTRTLQEVVLVEHFLAPINFTVLDLADWVKAFSDFPDAQQLPVAGPVNLSAQPSFAFGLFAPGSELPRLLLRSASGTRTVQLQQDRFAFGWTRPTPVGYDAEYPGYDALKREWVETRNRFHEWCEQRFGTAPGARMVELGYNNAAPLVVDGRIRKLSEIFSWIQPNRKFGAFQVSWTELLDPVRPDQARVDGVVAVGSALPVLQALIFNFSGFCPVTDGSEASILGAMDKLHDRTVDMYKSIIVGEGEASA